MVRSLRGPDAVEPPSCSLRSAAGDHPAVPCASSP